MTKLAHELSLTIAGKIGDLVYQRTRKGKGNIPTPGHYDLQLRRALPQIDPQTPGQLRQRRRIAAASAAYKNLSDAERAALKTAAAGQRGTGYALFVRNFCAQHPAEEFE